MNKRICIFMMIAALMFCMIGCSKEPANTKQPGGSAGTQETTPNDSGAGQESNENEAQTNDGSQTPNSQNGVSGGDTPVSNESGKVEKPNNTTQGNNGGSTNTSDNKENVSNSNGGQGNDTENTPGGNSGSTVNGNSGTVTTVPEKTEDCSYEEYHAMTPEAQQKFFNKFESVEAFFVWYNAAKAKYEKDNAAIEIGSGGQIDLGEVIGGGK